MSFWFKGYNVKMPDKDIGRKGIMTEMLFIKSTIKLLQHPFYSGKEINALSLKV
jgi:hypothetical protein